MTPVSFRLCRGCGEPSRPSEPLCPRCEREEVDHWLQLESLAQAVDSGEYGGEAA